MRRWTSHLWRALSVLGETYCSSGYGYLCDPWSIVDEFPVTVDDAAVRAAFSSIVVREWGDLALGPAPAGYGPDVLGGATADRPGPTNGPGDSPGSDS